MTDNELNKLLKKANNERLFGETAEALAIYHRIYNEYPDNIDYLGLLASTYYEEKEYDVALEYCDKADTIDPDNANVLDLRGLIAYDKGDKKLAEEYYRKALKKEPLLIGCRLKLIRMLFEQERYENVVEECRFVLKNNDADRENYPIKEKTQLFVSYLYDVYSSLWRALVHLKEYKEAISVIHEYVKSCSTTVKDPYFFDREDDLLYKLYYLISDEENIAKYTDRWRNHYTMSEKYVESKKKYVEQDYILDFNPDNYEFDEKGRFL